MYTRNEMLIMLASGAVIGGYLTYHQFAKKYNKLVVKYNFQLEREKIQQRIFKEVMPQLPDDYNLSEDTMVDIKSWNMFQENGI